MDEQTVETSLTRERILALQAAMVPLQCPLPDPVHRFAPGVYLRELCVPAGMLVMGKTHRHAHYLLVLSGVAIVKSEFGDDVVHAGDVIFSQPGVKRAALAITDTRFLTIHPNPDDSQDLDVIEARVIEPETLPCVPQEVLK